MSVRCARCAGRLTLVRTERTETRQHGVVELEHWRCTDACRGGGHRVRDLESGAIVHVAGPVLDYAPRPRTRSEVSSDD